MADLFETHLAITREELMRARAEDDDEVDHRSPRPASGGLKVKGNLVRRFGES